MKRFLLHFAILIVSGLVLTGASSCSVDNSFLAEKGETDVYLSILLRTVGADPDTEIPDIEKISDFMVLVADGDGKLVGKASGNMDYADETVETIMHVGKLKVPRDMKVYAIANYDMVDTECNTGDDGLDFDEMVLGSDVRSAIENCVFKFDTSKGKIPLYGYGEINIGDVKNGETYPVLLNMVRVATKFEFTIHNRRNENISVSGLEISGLAENQFLAPRFSFKPGETSSKGVISNTGRHGFYFGDITDPFNASGGLLSWDEWLEKAVVESHEKPEDQSLADNRGWIMEYETPAAANHTSRSWSLSAENCVVPAKTGELTLPIHYYAESRDGILDASVAPVAGNDSDRRGTDYVNSKGETVNARNLIHNDAAGFQQYYYFKISFKPEMGDEKTFYLDFYNLRALFRNTHVKVDITVSGSSDTPEVDWIVFTRAWNTRIHKEIIL